VGVVVKDAENHLAQWAGFFQECGDFPDSNLRCFTPWIAVNSGADGREGDTLEIFIRSEIQALPVA
jgi:hypothetical protein